MEGVKSRAIGMAGLVFAMVGVVGCGDGMTGPEVIEEVEFAASLGINLAAMTKTASGLYYEDIEVGTGERAVATHFVRIAYTGWLTNGEVFDSHDNFEFRLGAGLVVPGFDEGVGMRVGGVRRIIIPPALGYGSQESEAVPANSIMIFRIELLEID